MGHCCSLALQDLAESIRQVCRAGPLLRPPSFVSSHTVQVCVLRPQAVCTSFSCAVRPVISILFWLTSSGPSRLRWALLSLHPDSGQWTITQHLSRCFMGAPLAHLCPIISCPQFSSSICLSPQTVKSFSPGPASLDDHEAASKSLVLCWVSPGKGVNGLGGSCSLGVDCPKSSPRAVEFSIGFSSLILFIFLEPTCEVQFVGVWCWGDQQ